MFVVHNDMTIYATRGDVVYFPVEKKVGEAKYQFQPGDIVRIRVCEKKNYAKVFLLKDFEVEEPTTSVNIFLSKWEMKFGPIISKPTEYWYEVELNPDTYPDTFIGHNENGPAVFKLFPEAKDVVDGEIPDPEENGAVSRMVVHFVNEYLGGNAEEIILQEITKPEYADIIIQEIIKDKHIGTIVQEIVKEENIGPIVQEITKPEHTQPIVQEVLKPENAAVIVEIVSKDIPGHLEVTLDDAGMASHSASEINAHIDNGGSVVLNFSGYSSNGGYAQLWFRSDLLVIFAVTDVSDLSVSQTLYAIGEDKTCGEETLSFKGGNNTNKTFDHIKVTENADGSVTMENTFTDGTSETIALAAGEKPDSVTYNGVAIPIEWAVSE